MTTAKPCDCAQTDELLTTAAVASRLFLSVGTLQNWRSADRGGPPYVKVGARVRYRASDLREWIEQLSDEG
ncbi:AlpA family transcriptional regulator [Arthrobacter sp. B1805]|uniref:helix-turn-helix transcriptional regulator n=1 Tax=Arthrobacter sp. B1805 TaxID=2058892 RepID=UPI000CE34206|nr:helix-turn-helix domain-containing protein [Arthrobacter sp. B1805]